MEISQRPLRVTGSLVMRSIFSTALVLQIVCSARINQASQVHATSFPQLNPATLAPSRPPPEAPNHSNLTNIIRAPAPVEPSSDPPECFPGSAVVEVKGRGETKMRDLKIGDKIKTSRGQFSDVILFTHKGEKHVGMFIQIKMENGKIVKATRGHYLYVNGRLAPAHSVKAGDTLRGWSDEIDGGKLLVRQVRRVREEGLHNPQTIDGDILVNGVSFSTFTTAIHPWMARNLMKPVSMLYQLGLASEAWIGSIFKKELFSQGELG